MTKRFTIFALIVLIAFAVVPAFANTAYSGSDTACFYYFNTGCTATSGTVATGADLSGGPFLTFTTDTWSDDIGPQIALGTFDVPATYLGGDIYSTFVLDVTFTSPPDGSQDYTATVTGGVLVDHGLATITFNPSSETFGTGANAFTFTLDPATVDVYVDQFGHPGGNAVTLYGDICPPTATPEPASVSTVLGGLMLAGITVYRRRAANVQ